MSLLLRQVDETVAGVSPPCFPLSSASLCVVSSLVPQDAAPQGQPGLSSAVVSSLVPQDAASQGQPGPSAVFAVTVVVFVVSRCGCCGCGVFCFLSCAGPGERLQLSGTPCPPGAVAAPRVPTARSDSVGRCCGRGCCCGCGRVCGRCCGCRSLLCVACSSSHSRLFVSLVCLSLPRFSASAWISCAISRPF